MNKKKMSDGYWLILESIQMMTFLLFYIIDIVYLVDIIQITTHILLIVESKRWGKRFCTQLICLIILMFSFLVHDVLNVYSLHYFVYGIQLPITRGRRNLGIKSHSVLFMRINLLYNFFLKIFPGYLGVQLFFQNIPQEQRIYFFIQTITTLGYGDIIPETNEQRTYISCLLLLKIFLLWEIYDQTNYIRKVNCHHQTQNNNNNTII